LIIPFSIATLACTIKVSGAVTAHQRLNDANWCKPEMSSISRGSLIDSLGTILCGLLGSFGQNISSSALGLSLSTGVGCRRVAYSFAVIFWSLSFSPKFALILVLTPSPVVAVILIFLAATLLVTGLKTIIPRMTVSYRAVVIGISFMLGISRDIYPQTYEHLPSILQTLTGSSIAFATVSAIILNFIAMLSINDSKIARIMINSDSVGYKNGMQFLESLKKDWDLPISLFEDAKEAFSQLMNLFMAKKITNDLITFDIGLTRSQFDLTVSYSGNLIKPVNQKSRENLESNDEVFIPLASNVSCSQHENASSLHISFDY
jgi:xanthine permease XanP